jgi:large repetitive protein
LNDQGTTTTPAHDVVTDFNTASIAAGGDVLNLKDLLIGEHDGTGASINLESYLHFDLAPGTTDTVISISSQGSTLPGGAFDSSHIDQTITLAGVDLVTAHGGDQAAIIQSMIDSQKLITDH